MTSEDDDQRLARWAAHLTAALAEAGFPVGDLEVDVDAILGLAGRAAHAVIRPAAPLTTFIVGYAAGAAVAAGRTPEDTIADSTRTALTAAEQARDDAASVAPGPTPGSTPDPTPSSTPGPTPGSTQPSDQDTAPGPDRESGV